MFKNHPKGLLVLALTNMGERFGYYTMLAILTLYMQAKFGLSSAATSQIYGSFLALVYFLPLLGGIIADKALGYGKTILLGIVVMFSGYLLLALPSGASVSGKIMMFGALALIAMGTGFFKGNLQALGGNLYEAPQYSRYRDIAFSIFYMFINIGAFFAPNAANAINNTIMARDGFVYDASIPKNYVALNDRVVDSETYVIKAQELIAEKDITMEDALRTLKKKDGVMFQEDYDKIIFRLKASGLNQYTKSGKLIGEQSLTDSEYALLDSRNSQDDIAKAAVIARINTIHVEDATLGGGNDETFAKNFGDQYVSTTLSRSYALSFGVACISLLISVLIFLLFRKTWKPVDKTQKQLLKEAATGKKVEVAVLTKEQTRERMIALFLVFFVVIFFWMSFHQNGLCMTFFARDYTASTITPAHNMMFNLLSLIPFVAVLYGVYIATLGLFGGKPDKKKGIIISAVGMICMVLYYLLKVRGVTEMVKITPQIFQQFNPLFIVLLTPLTVALFTSLNNKGKEPSAPRKIGYGMVIAVVGFIILAIASIGLPNPSEISGNVSNVLVSPNWLIGTYFTLTIAELFLSPMGLAFVAKVAPPQYKGMMQGGWLAATAIGNYLVGFLGSFWEKLPIVAFWCVLVACCLLSALFIFSVMKRLERVTK